jgi:hypothetical protein
MGGGGGLAESRGLSVWLSAGIPIGAVEVRMRVNFIMGGRGIAG